MRVDYGETSRHSTLLLFLLSLTRSEVRAGCTPDTLSNTVIRRTLSRSAHCADRSASLSTYAPGSDRTTVRYRSPWRPVPQSSPEVGHRDHRTRSYWYGRC